MLYQTLHQPACDFFFLQTQYYPCNSSLEWVGNCYRLSRMQKQLLQRGVFAQARCRQRRAKRCMGAVWQSSLLMLDGYNVQITVESAILGRPLLLANDGALRDLAGQSASFRCSDASPVSMEAILRFLAEFPPKVVVFLFDSPVSHSGQLAGKVREMLRTHRFNGDARTAAVPEREFLYEEGVTASSDQAVIDASCNWLDVARRVIDWAA